MNVDEAMEIATSTAITLTKLEMAEVSDVLAKEVERLRAEVQRLDIAGMHSCHENCPKLPCVQRREIERLKAELAQSRKDWCDDDEAIKRQALRVLDAAKVEGDSVYVPRMGALAEMMTDEVERLRIWNKRWRDISAKLRLTVTQLYEELAAAKAASVCPIKFSWRYETNEYDILITGMSDEDSTKLGNWLNDRMKAGEK